MLPLVTMSLLGCAELAPQEENPEVELASEESPLFLTGGKWPNGQIPVCWSTHAREAPSATNNWDGTYQHAISWTNAANRQRVRDVVSATWEVAANVHFTGWGNCPANTAGMVELIAENGNVTGAATLGYNGAGARHFVWLSTERWDFWGGFLPHEFGHVLGFEHEHARADFDDDDEGSCRSDADLQGNTLGTPPDRNSVMVSTGYCQTNEFLSRWDVVGAQAAYGVSERWDDLTAPGTFDPTFYLNYYPDLKATFGNDLEGAKYHWVTAGFREGRRSSLEFDVQNYMGRYGDLRNAFGATNWLAGIYHWNDWGLREGRRSSSDFDVSFYVNHHADLKNAFGTNYAAALQHWLVYGQREGRRSYPDGDIPLVGDFDGDGQLDDLATWRASDGTWRARRYPDAFSWLFGDNIMDGIQWGTQGDIPLVGDFDSDGRVDDLGIFRPSNGRWYAKRINNTVIFDGIEWGTAGDIPLVGDFDSDGQRDDLGIFRPGTGRWYAKRTNNTVIFDGQLHNIQWGTAGDVPLVGDFDSDGQFDDLGIWRPSNGYWYAKRTNNTVIFDGQLQNIQWGRITDIPVVGDLDSDGRVDDIGVWRPTNALWYAKRTNNTVIYSDVALGQPR